MTATTNIPPAAEAPSSSTKTVDTKQRRRRPGIASITRYAILVLMVIVLAGPLLWQVSLALKGPGEDLFQRPPALIPAAPTLDNFAAVLDRIPVLQYVGNSAMVALISIAGNVIGATFAGYALARLRFRGRSAATVIIVAALLVPTETVIISQFLVVRSIGLTDTLMGVALPTLVAALNVMLMRNAFAGLPNELEEAARVDGANAWQRFFNISVPQVKGIISVVAIFAFVGSWNDFLWPLIVLSDESNYTLTIGLNRLRGTFYDDPRLIAAGTVLALIPIVVFFAALQRYFFKGLESGGLKG